MFFFPFLCSGIPDLALEILKMLIRVCFLDVLQPAIYQFFPGSFYIRCTVFTVLLFTSISYVQESFKLKKWIMDKSVFLYWWFSFDLKYYLILGSTNNVLHSSVKENLCTLWSLALAKNSCNNINNSHAQVSKLCHFLWLWINQI